MSFLEKIRAKSQAEKVRLIWIICGSIAVLLIIIWIFTSRLRQDLPKDTSLFKTIRRSIKNFTK